MKLLKKTYLGVILTFLYAPIIVLIIFSFNASKSRGVWGGFSLVWYKSLFHNSVIIEAFQNTIIIAVIAAVVSTIFGTAAAVGINALGRVPKKIVMNVSKIPVLNADIVTGISLMILFLFSFKILNLNDARLGFMTMLIAHITFDTPYVILSVLPKLRQVDDRLYEAALDLGATPMYAFFKVILPELAPAILSGFILAFTLSIDDFVISFFTTGSGISNLSIFVYTAAKKGVTPEINALSAIMFVVVIVLLVTVNLIDVFQNKKKRKEILR